MVVEGSCHCGFITYEAQIEPETAGVCQSLTGSAFRTFVLSIEGGFRLLSGQPKAYTKVGESGAKGVQTFCPECGSPIYSTSDGNDPKIYSLRTGTIRQRSELVPRAQIWTRSAQPWLGVLSDIPGQAKQGDLASALNPRVVAHRPGS
jgi:hypothetical protein